MTADARGAGRFASSAPESAYAWLRLALLLLISTIGGVGMWAVVVALPAIQADFGVTRGLASFPYTMTMLAFGAGGIILGRMSDRMGVAATLALGGAALGIGYVLAAYSPNIWVFTLVNALLVGMIGAAAMFGPLIADISMWFTRRRGLAVAICASGNYMSGVVWPPLVQRGVEAYGWRATYIAIGIACVLTIVPLTLLLRRRPPTQTETATGMRASGDPSALGLSKSSLQWLIGIAGVACCVAMSMPQVHIVAYCGDLGYGVARGAEMLSLMLGFGIVSRIGSGFIADRIGGIATLLLGSMLQNVALLLYLGFDGLTSLYIISALFGLFQGGIVPSYALIVREYFPASEAGMRVGVAMMATLIGMALGGWLSGVIFDYTGSYAAAFANGVLWNILNLAIAGFLLIRARGGGRLAPA